MVESMTASGMRAKSMVLVFLLMLRISTSWVNTTKARKAETGSVKLHLLKNNRSTSKRRVKIIKGGFRENSMSSKRNITSTPDEDEIE